MCEIRARCLSQQYILRKLLDNQYTVVTNRRVRGERKHQPQPKSHFSHSLIFHLSSPSQWDLHTLPVFWEVTCCHVYQAPNTVLLCISEFTSQARKWFCQMLGGRDVGRWGNVDYSAQCLICMCKWLPENVEIQMLFHCVCVYTHVCVLRGWW